MQLLSILSLISLSCVLASQNLSNTHTEPEMKSYHNPSNTQEEKTSEDKMKVISTVSIEDEGKTSIIHYKGDPCRVYLFNDPRPAPFIPHSKTPLKIRFDARITQIDCWEGLCTISLDDETFFNIFKNMEPIIVTDNRSAQFQFDGSDRAPYHGQIGSDTVFDEPL